MSQLSKRTVYTATFEAEKYWQSNQTANIPFIKSSSSELITSVMDELQVVFCENKNDVLITRLPIQQCLKEYLHDIGFEFENNDFPITDTINEGINDNDNELIINSKNQFIKDIFSNNDILLSPYAVLPGIEKICNRFSIANSFPDQEVIKKVNSKAYSFSFNEIIIPFYEGKFILDTKQLLQDGEKYLAKSPFLIKEEFGVSGKGNMLINSRGLLNRAIKYLEKEEKLGKKVRLILEPFYEKDYDFCSQFEIYTDGTFKLHSVNKLINSIFSYSGSKVAESKFYDELDKKKYFEVCHRLMNKLYDDGYYGHVCIDSMMLKNGDIFPVVEINARKSMSLINNQIDRYVRRFDGQSNLNRFSLSIPKDMTYENIFDKLKKENILFSKENPTGLLPITSNTLDINRLFLSTEDKMYTGLLYASVVGKENETQSILNNFKNILDSLSIQHNI